MQMKNHIAKLKEIAKKYGILQLGNILESSLILTKEYRDAISRCVFGGASLDTLAAVTHIPSKDELLTVEALLEEPGEPGEGEYLA
jgi:hypothetical protein